MTVIPYTSRDFETIKESLSVLMRETRPEFWSDFFESNLGVALIDLVAAVGDMLSFGQDVAATEIFLSTLRRYDSALRFARSVGYVPRSATPALVTVTSVVLPSNIAAANGAVVPAGSRIVGLNGLPYQLLEDVTIFPTDTVSRLILEQSDSYEEPTTPAALQNQEIVTLNGGVADNSWEVFVGAPVPLNRWRQVDRVKLEDGPSETYEAFLDGDGRLHIVFGDGTSGAIPNQTVVIRYRTTSGLEGNTPTGSIRGSIQANLILGGGTVSIEYTNVDNPASNGRNRESIDELRVNIPAYIRSSDKIVTLDDYNSNVARIPGVALTFTDLLISSFSGNVVKVHVWDEEQIEFRSESPVTGEFSDALYTRYAQVPLDRANTVQQFLVPRTLVSVQNIIVRPTTASVDIYLGSVQYDGRFERADVHQAITEAVIAVFESSSGFAIRVSDVYEAIDSALGVRYFYIERIVAERLERVPASGSIEVTAIPPAGEYVTIDDGKGFRTYEVVAALGDPVTVASNIPVEAGASTGAFATNLTAAILNAQGMNAGVDLSGPNPTVLLTSSEPGTIGNTPIGYDDYNNPGSPSGALVEVGMQNGSDVPTTKWVDYRRVQNPGNADPYPPGSYLPGVPYADGGVGLLDGYEPLDGDVIVVEDGIGNIFTFEFDDNAVVSPGAVPVGIAGDVATTMQNLATAISARFAPPLITVGTVATLEAFVLDTGVPTVQIRKLVANATLTISSSVPANQLAVSAGAWVDGGILAYEPIQDIIIQSARTTARYYDETYLYNNEIRYDSGVASLLVSVQALNLRRLVFELVAV